MFSTETAKCPYLTKRDTIVKRGSRFLSGMEAYPFANWSAGGICDISEDRQTPCQYPMDTSACENGRLSDLCDRDWAKT